MDVFRASNDYIPPQGCRGVIPLKEGDFFEVLESEQSRFHKDWWGVRRTGDNVIGYVPAKFIKFEETRPEDVLPENYLEQREMYVRQLHEMERANEPNLPDLYRVPPLATKSYDDWRELDPDDPAAGVEPDYSDDSDDEAGAPYPDPETNHAAPPSNGADSNALSKDDWDKILASADMDLPDSPISPEPDFPEPDYQDEEGIEDDDSQDGKKYKYQVILPAPDAGKFLGGDGTGAGEIQPKKLVNPVLQSKDHKKLHREMMMNQKLGIDVLNKKSELKKTFENKKIEQAKKAKAEESKANKNPFQLKLEEQAEKLRLYEAGQKSPKELSPTAKSPTSPKVALKPAAKKKEEGKTDQNQNQSEFLRVHSKIIKNPPS